MIYLISDGEKVKIGYSKNPQKRLKQLQTGHPNRLKLIKIWDAEPVKEKLLHRMLWMFHKDCKGEWFTIGVDDCVEVMDKVINRGKN